MVWEIRDSQARPSEVHGPNACQNEMAAFHEPYGRARHSVRAVLLVDSNRRARSDAPCQVQDPNAQQAAEEALYEPTPDLGGTSYTSP